VKGPADALVIDPRDNVATALRALTAGQRAQVGAAPAAGAGHAPEGAFGLVLLEPVPAYHKVALRDIPAAQPVIKYGEAIGTALRDIRAGQHVHVHNLAGRRGTGGGAHLGPQGVPA